MAIPVYLFLYDEEGELIKGDVDITNREGSIEVLELMHSIELPVDNFSGKIMGKRLHSSYSFEKEVDSSSPYLYQSLTNGRKIRRAEFKFYKINNTGLEEHYFTTSLEGVIVSGITPLMMDIKDTSWEKHNHHEYIDLRYNKITWGFIKGNIIHSDSWLERT